jgi:integrase/recombinase XerD
MGRHTLATVCSTNDIDVYTVIKLLGHSTVTTTEVYAKIIDKKNAMK